MKKKKAILAIVVFYVIALLLRYLTNKTELLSAISNPYLVIILKGMGPAIGALVAMIAFRIKPTMSLKGNFGNTLIPLSIYWLLAIVLIGIVAYLTTGNFPAIGIFTILVYGLLEEIGWRGFLQQLIGPKLKFAGIVLITVLWFVWHMNFSLSSSNILFFFILLAGSWGIGIVAEKTYSLLAAAAFHSLNNFFTELNSQKISILIILITCWVLSVIYRKKLEKIKI